MQLKMFVLVMVLIIAFSFLHIGNCQKNLLDRRLLQKICGNKNSTSSLSSSVGSCADSLSTEIKTIYSTCLTSLGKSVSPEDILSVVCSSTTRTQFNRCYQTEEKKLRKESPSANTFKSIKQFKDCLKTKVQ